MEIGRTLRVSSGTDRGDLSPNHWIAIRSCEAIGRAQARALLEHSIDNLSPDEQAVYPPKLEALTVDLKHGDP